MFPRILKKKSVIILIVLAFLAAGALMTYSFAPVISVEGERYSLRHFLKVQSAVRNMDMLSNNGVLKLTDEEVKQRVFGNIIDKVFLDKLIAQADTSLEKRADELVRQALEQNPNLRLDEAAKKLYGLSAKDFTELVLLPQAKRDLLTERFAGNPGQLNEMWDSLVKNADIKIYYPGYKWENGGGKEEIILICRRS